MRFNRYRQFAVQGFMNAPTVFFGLAWTDAFGGRSQMGGKRAYSGRLGKVRSTRHSGHFIVSAKLLSPRDLLFRNTHQGQLDWVESLQPQA